MAILPSIGIKAIKRRPYTPYKSQPEKLRCAFVLLCFDRGQHAVIAFDTADRGLVYIEPQTDAVIHPEVGGKYEGKEIKEILIAW